MIRSLMTEKTLKQAPQVSIDDMLYENQLPQKEAEYSYLELREFQKDATVALIREVSPGPILASNWTIEGEDEDRVARLKEDLMRLRNQFLVQAVRGLNDFGWMPFEVVWGKDEEGYIRIKKLKALLHEFTWILVNNKGAFRGFRQQDMSETNIPLNKCLLLCQDVEGTDWYGNGKLPVAGRVVDNWDNCNDGADRYDQKIAGSHWVVYYPIGETRINGVDKDNFEIAGDILEALESSGKMRIPSTIESELEELNKSSQSAWKIDTISDSQARQHSFVARLEYLDKLKCRAYGFPEDVILKTRYSPKTEQGVHANIIATAQDVQHQYIVDMLNEHVVKKTLIYNHGKSEKDSVRIIPAPITNMSLSFLQETYKMLLNNQIAVQKEYQHVDMAELRTKIGVPHDGEVEEITEEELAANNIDPREKAVEDPTENGSFKQDGGVQN